MSHALSKSPSNEPPTPDFTALASMFQDIAQVLLRYGEKSEAKAQSQSEQHSDAQAHSPTPTLSTQAKRRECYKEFCYSPHDSRAFADKEAAQYFEKAYTSGNFNAEIRYYYVPANIVRHEYRLLCRHQQKDIVSLLSSVHNELDLKSKLIGYMKQDIAELPLLQLSDSISQSLTLFHTICAYLDDFKLVHKTMLPRQIK